eukprot:CAMPEP_0198304826 /NCGR_PEP_ID=MMETSP1449-20131203/57599_1 /TAXON_ID=420275 /ORGANISM="Attheya septentrionalis, Strain CCMP2084" /LENGTH=33 /DNA_ID= /DNA_START= /DNA_END= /DNA_ORIENTATION=
MAMAVRVSHANNLEDRSSDASLGSAAAARVQTG